MADLPVRVRIAPSPSGYLHVGTARMAIANFLFARHFGGKFLVRIEDTDVARSDANLVEPILSALKWLDIESDEPIIFQSQRTELYKKCAQEILNSGHGYRCFCSSEQLEADRNKAIAEKTAFSYNRRCLKLLPAEVERRVAKGERYATRLFIPEGESVFDDMVSGEIRRKNEDIEDFVIARSDGTATYNLAVVVDDHSMGISHVIRGNDHITNTFKQMHIYKALGWERPIFGHLPLILRPDKKKVSKRLGDKDVQQYQQEGILPEAMFNFLALLGWSPKSEREIYTVEELIGIFDPEHFNVSNAVFNEEKLVAFNRAHIAMKSDHELASLAAPLLVEAGLTTKYWLETRWEYLRQVIALLKERVKRVSDFASLGGYFFTADYDYVEEAAQKHLTVETRPLLVTMAERFDGLGSFTHETTETTLSSLAAEMGIKKGQLIHPVRLAVSGMTEGPGLFDMLVVLGKTSVVQRLRKAVEYIDNNRNT